MCFHVLDMKNNPFEIVNDDLLDMKKKFEQLETAYLSENVAAAGLCWISSSALTFAAENGLILSETSSSI